MATPTPIRGARPIGAPSPTAASALTATARSGEPAGAALSGIVRGRLAMPYRILVIGEPGVGKTTLATCAPRPLLLESEDGSEEYDAARLRIRSWAHYLSALDELNATPPDAREFSTVATDTVDHLEAMCWQHVCQAAGKSSIKDFKYGDGYAAAFEQMRLAASKLERINTWAHVVMLAHSKVKTRRNPHVDDFDAFAMPMNDKVGSFWVEWAKATLFATFDIATVQSKVDERTRGLATGKRVLHCNYGTAWTAKNRYGLPDQIELRPEDPWGSLASEIETGRALLRELDGMADRLSATEREEFKNKLRAPMGRAALLAMRDDLSSRLGSSPANEPAKEV